MDTTSDEFVRVLAYVPDRGRPKPMEALQRWLRERGINEMPIDAADVLVTSPCGYDKDGNWDRGVSVHIRAAQLRRLGLQHDGPTSD
jgi:hypothetical protein